jgi:hypothetical protein
MTMSTGVGQINNRWRKDNRILEDGVLPNSSLNTDGNLRTVISGGKLTWQNAKKGFKTCCGPIGWRKKVPFTYWLPKYSFLDFKGDMIAGITVGMTVVPQGLAYAGIAELPLEVHPTLHMLVL